MDVQQTTWSGQLITGVIQVFKLEGKNNNLKNMLFNDIQQIVHHTIT